MTNKAHVIVTRLDPEPKVLFDAITDNFSVGRLLECAVRMPHVASVSPLHAEFVWREGALWITDNWTTGGTFVGETKVLTDPVAVPTGSTLRFGDVATRVDYTPIPVAD